MKVLFLTGAGISANAGIATYRDGGSSWVDSDLEKKSHASRYGNHLDELWDKHWGPVQKAMDAAVPTIAHKAITEFQQKHDAIIATQNIDHLHEHAGNENVMHLHGDMDTICMRCKSQLIDIWDGSGAPQCLNCESRKTRPNVVLFGENLKKKEFNAIEHWAKSEADFVIAVGTSLNVFPAAGLVMDNSKKSIIINKQKTPFDKFALDVFNEDADTALPRVLTALEERMRLDNASKGM